MPKGKALSISAGDYWVENGIVFAMNKKNEINRDDALEIADKVVKLMQKEKTRLVIVDLGDTKSVSSEARDILGNIKTDRIAMIVRNPVSRIIGSFFLRVNRKGQNGKLCPDVGEARRWVLQGG